MQLVFQSAETRNFNRDQYNWLEKTDRIRFFMENGGILDLIDD